MSARRPSLLPGRDSAGARCQFGCWFDDDRVAYPQGTAGEDAGTDPAAVVQGVARAGPDLVVHLDAGITEAGHGQHDLAHAERVAYCRVEGHPANDDLPPAGTRRDGDPQLRADGRERLFLDQRYVAVP